MHLSLFVSVVEVGVMVSGIFPWHTLTPWYQQKIILAFPTGYLNLTKQNI